MKAWRGWLPLLVLPAGVVLLTPGDAPRWAFMWLLAFAIYVGCKWLTWRRTPVQAPWWRHAGYLLAWPGLDPVSFLKGTATRPAASEWAFAVAKVMLGVGLMWGVFPHLVAERPLLAGWVGMAGIVFFLHFGTFDLLRCFWQTLGVEARPLMNWPIASAGVSEFWGRRWNTAFRDLTHRFLFQPLTPRFGARGALLAGFVFSGLVHDFVISVSAGGGYGGPTVFFLIQGGALFAERSAVGKRLGLGRGWRGRLFTAAALLLPAPMLFHPPFALNIIVPFLEAVGAGSPSPGRM